MSTQQTIEEWQARMLDEYNILVERIVRARKVLEEWSHELKTIPTSQASNAALAQRRIEYVMLDRQLGYMVLYREYLLNRLEYYNIQVEEGENVDT